MVSDERHQGGRSATIAGLFNFEKKIKTHFTQGNGVKENRWFIGGSEVVMEESFSVCLMNFFS